MHKLDSAKILLHQISWNSTWLVPRLFCNYRWTDETYGKKPQNLNFIRKNKKKKIQQVNSFILIKIYIETKTFWNIPINHQNKLKFQLTVKDLEKFESLYFSEK